MSWSASSQARGQGRERPRSAPVPDPADAPSAVGETLGGGAHPGGGFRSNDHFLMFVPTGRAINPITKTNWEGTGVLPGVKAPAAQALEVAHRMAVERFMERADEDGRRQIQADLDRAKMLQKRAQ